MLDIDPDKVCYIIVKAREFEAEIPQDESEEESGGTEDEVREDRADYENDLAYQELKEFLTSLNEEEMVSLLALTWLGRGDYTKDDWESVIEEAREIRDDRAVSYLLGTPLLPDYLEEGLDALGFSCEDYETDRL